MWYWTYAAIHQMKLTAEAGRRTWFGSLTLTPEWQAEFERRAREGFMAGYGSSDIPAWWDDPTCDERFLRVRNEIVPEVQKFWKRLRKAGHQFKYLLVFERHKSGLPHMHFLLHEQEGPILQREIQAQWTYGFSQVNLVKTTSKGKRRSPEKAAFYVAKYLQKSDQSRQLASEGYRPPSRNVRTEDKSSARALSHSRRKDGVKETPPDTPSASVSTTTGGNKEQGSNGNEVSSSDGCGEGVA